MQQCNQTQPMWEGKKARGHSGGMFLHASENDFDGWLKNGASSVKVGSIHFVQAHSRCECADSAMPCRIFMHCSHLNLLLLLFLSLSLLFSFLIICQMWLLNCISKLHFLCFGLAVNSVSPHLTTSFSSQVTQDDTDSCRVQFAFLWNSMISLVPKGCTIATHDRTEGIFVDVQQFSSLFRGRDS